MSIPSPLAGEGDSAPAERGEGSARLRAKAMRRNMTHAEIRLWRMLRDRRFQGWKFRRQVPLGPFIADFACFSARLLVEADGGQHCDSSYDARRTAWLERHGWRVLRFWNHEILQQVDNVADRLFAALADPSPRSPAASRPLPQGERG